MGPNGRRIGANQYTRGRDAATEDTPGPNGESHTNGNSGGGSPAANGVHHNGIINGESGRSSKAKTHPARTSLNEMKRRVAAILEFVNQMQAQTELKQPSTASKNDKNGKGTGGESSGSEKGGASTPSAGGAVQDPAAAAAAAATAGAVADMVKAVRDATADLTKTDSADSGNNSAEGENANNDNASATSAGSTLQKAKFRDDADFASMSASEMMEALKQELISWQACYGVWAR
jgi:hypothetical protein